MSWLRTHRFWLPRRASQLGILLLFWLGARHHVGILTGNLSSSHIARTVPLSDPFAVAQILATGQPLAKTALLGAGIVLVFYFLVGGRAFCGWVCPVNLVSDGSHFLRRRYSLRNQFRVPRATRFGFLFLSLPLSALLGVAAFEWISPIGIIHRELIFGPGLGLVVIPMLVVADLFLLRRGWCASVCPLGAMYSLVGHKSPLRMGFRADRCDHCGDCIDVCPEPQVLDFHSMAGCSFVDSGDCLNCGRCLEVCPRDVYHITLRPRTGVMHAIHEGDDHEEKNAA